MGLGGVAIAVPPYVIHPKTAVLGRVGGLVLFIVLIPYRIPLMQNFFAYPNSASYSNTRDE